MNILDEIVSIIKEEAGSSGLIKLKNETKKKIFEPIIGNIDVVKKQKQQIHTKQPKDLGIITPSSSSVDIISSNKKNDVKKQFALEFPKIENDSLEKIAREIEECKKCNLCSSRTNTVPGEGNLKAELMLIGEGPGKDEDEQGKPFVGRSGQLLTKMLNAMGYQREDVFIANIVKCRPPNNRNPLPDEAQNCIGFLLRQIKIVSPKVIVLLGAVPMKYILGQTGISKIHGDFFDFNGITTVPTFHPAYLLRDPRQKKHAWEDLKKVMTFLGRKVEENRS